MRVFKRLIFNGILLFAAQLSFGQPAVRYPAVILGLETGGGFSIVSKRAVGTIPRYWTVRYAPYASFKINKYLYLGLNYEHQVGKLEGSALPDLRGAGIHSTFFLPLGNASFLVKNRFKFYTSLQWIRLDHFLDSHSPYGVSKLDGFTNNNFNLSVGMDIRIFNSLYLDLGFRHLYFSRGRHYINSETLALEYQFGEKRAPYVASPPKQVEHKQKYKKALDLSYIFDKTTVGTSYTFIWDNNNTENYFYYKESTLNLNIATSITSDLDLGLAVLPIWTNSLSDGKKQYLLAGIFAQYDFLRLQSGRSRIFVETGLYNGNLCTCGDNIPFYRPNLTYLPWGGGLEHRLLKNFPVFLDLSFQWYNILNKLPYDKWAYSQYVVGLNYHIYSN